MSSTLRLYTDFVCPFCFIAEESVVPRLLSEFDLELDWHGFELHPGTPRGGRPLGTLFPGVDLARLHAQTKQFAAGFGVTGFEPPNTLRNTRRALAVAELARDRGCLAPFRGAAFRAHWRQGKNLEDFTDLGAIALEAGLDPDEAMGAADSETLLARVDAHQEEARAQGVRSIPTFLLIGERARQAIVGCQAYPTVAAAAQRVGAAPRPAQR